VLPPVLFELLTFVPEEVELDGPVESSEPGPKDGLLASVPDERSSGSGSLPSSGLISVEALGGYLGRDRKGEPSHLETNPHTPSPSSPTGAFEQMMRPWRGNHGERRVDRRRALEERYHEARQRIKALDGSAPPKLFFGDLGQARAEKELRKAVQQLKARTQDWEHRSSAVTDSGDSAPAQVLAMSNA
jgi:hypothetical protein